MRRNEIDYEVNDKKDFNLKPCPGVDIDSDDERLGTLEITRKKTSTLSFCILFVCSVVTLVVFKTNYVW